MVGSSQGRNARRRFALGVSLVSAFGVALLVGFHAWLLAQRLAEGRIAEPAVVLRWLAGLGLTAALIGLRRAGVPLLWGRKALVLWLLVLLLHWSATPAPERILNGVHAEEILLVIPATVATLVLAAALLATLPTGARELPLPLLRGRVALVTTADLIRDGFVPAFAARPPPA
jgi:hypothetical protein